MKLPWQWPSCKHPKTLSFRQQDNMFKTVNSMFFDPNTDNVVETPESWFTNSSESASFSTESDQYCCESLETVVRGGARSERLFFEPGGDTSSILEKPAGLFEPFEESSVVLAMESNDPYVDFRRSMEEMVETYGIKDWDCLEELLVWYLKVNRKKNHGFIISAFVDLLANITTTSTTTSDDSGSYSSAISSFNPCSHLSDQGDFT